MGQEAIDTDEALATLLADRYGLDPVSVGAVVDFARAGMAAGAAREALTGEPAQVLSIREMLELGRLEGEVRHRVLAEPMVEAAAAGALAGSSSASNTRQYAYKLRRSSALLGIPRRGGVLFPAFQFDRATRTIHDVVREVNRLLCADADPWGAAS